MKYVARTLAQRIEAYLDDAPGCGGHSDLAGGSAYDLLRDTLEELHGVAQASPNCDCGFSAEVCKTNPCMRKKMATSGLNPEAKYPYCGTESVAQASPSVQKAIAHFWTKATEYDHEKLRAIYNDMHELQDRVETIPLSQALDGMDLALQIIDRLLDATAGSANDPL